LFDLATEYDVRLDHVHPLVGCVLVDDERARRIGRVDEGEGIDVVILIIVGLGAYAFDHFGEDGLFVAGVIDIGGGDGRIDGGRGVDVVVCGFFLRGLFVDGGDIIVDVVTVGSGTLIKEGTATIRIMTNIALLLSLTTPDIGRRRDDSCSNPTTPLHIFLITLMLLPLLLLLIDHPGSTI